MSVALLVLKLIKDNWFPVSIVICLFSLYLYIGDLRGTINDLEHNLSVKEQKLSRCHSVISDNNSVIDKWNKDSELKQIQIDSVNTKITQLQITNKARIDKLLKQNSVNSCEGAIKYFVDLGVKYD